MKTFSIAVHGGAGEDADFIKENIKGYERGLREAVEAGNKILLDGGSAVDAVHEAVTVLENNPLFNSGRGSALNAEGKVEMDASIMDGKTVQSGAVSMLTNVKNPVTLCRFIMENAGCVFLSGKGALQYAAGYKIELETDAYFITEHQVDDFINARDKDTNQEILRKKIHGTVGAVALDQHGNVAAATSTGGIPDCLPGRIGDSCVIGAGCYANNETCAVSGTGDGELLVNNVIAHSVAAAIEYKTISLQEACDYIVLQKNKNVGGDIGVIAVDNTGAIGMSFNSERMHRAAMINNKLSILKIYP